MQQMLRSTYWRIALGAALLLVLVVSLVAGFQNWESVDFKVYPTSESLQDFYGRVFGKTRTEAISQTAATTQKQASELVGFQVLMPTFLPEGTQPITRIIVIGAHAYRVDVNLAAAHALLTAAGLTYDSIPEEQDSVQITAAIEPSVVIQYQGAQGFILIQGRNPVVSVSDDANLTQLRELGELGLQFLGLSPTEAHQLSQRMDWAAFLVLSPADMDSAEPVSINGHDGYALRSTEPGNDHAAVLWEAEGVLYGLYGGLLTTELVAIAESLE